MPTWAPTNGFSICLVETRTFMRLPAVRMANIAPYMGPTAIDTLKSCNRTLVQLEATPAETSQGYSTKRCLQNQPLGMLCARSTLNSSYYRESNGLCSNPLSLNDFTITMTSQLFDQVSTKSGPSYCRMHLWILSSDH